MVFEIAVLIVSLGVILISAGFFTNGVEWLGKKLGLTEGVVGSILAAVGTALPETVIPLIAILLTGGEVGHEIGIGAILGAPFMLATLAIFLSGGAVLFFRHRREQAYPHIEPDPKIIRRDLTFFLCVFTLAVLSTFLPRVLKLVVASALIVGYGVFVYRTVTSGDKLGEEQEMDPLLLARKSANPSVVLVIVQVVLALAGITAGAKFFVDGITTLSGLLGVPALIFSLIIAPLATEMPEKFNSIIWLGQSKDTLALGNITGAMVFQSSLIPAIGIIFTSWVLTKAVLLSAILTLVSALATYIYLYRYGFLDARLLLTCGGMCYIIFLVSVLV